MEKQWFSEIKTELELYKKKKLEKSAYSAQSGEGQRAEAQRKACNWNEVGQLRAVVWAAV